MQEKSCIFCCRHGMKTHKNGYAMHKRSVDFHVGPIEWYTGYVGKLSRVSGTAARSGRTQQSGGYHGDPGRRVSTGICGARTAGCPLYTLLLYLSGDIDRSCAGKSGTGYGLILDRSGIFDK